MIGASSKYYVEFGAWDGRHLSNTLNLRENFGWSGLLLDGKFDDPKINLHQHYLTAENIVTLFQKYSVPEKFDLLSIDIDGNDFYILKSILSSYVPRVIVCETNQLISPKIACTVKYNPEIYFDVNSRYFGASVKAFDDLCKQHSYIMVCQHDQNVFFLHKDDLMKLDIEIDGIGLVDHLFKPRIPRWYLQPNGKEIEFSKEYVEQLAFNGLCPEGLEPIIKKTMKNLDYDGDWIFL